ncbi:MAG: hypothetical protein WD076_01375 [Parvularculaceae bacterium]
MAALDRSDKSAAAEHALAAWTAAETALGAHPTTGVLAYNYGKLLAFDDPVAALPALRRADELMRSVGAELPPDESELLLAYVHYAASNRNMTDRRTLRTVLLAQAARNVPPSLESAQVWLVLAANDSNARRFNDAIDSAIRAEAAIIAVLPEDYRLRARAILISGVAHLAPRPRSVNDVEMANQEFVRAARLFPPQNDIESFDPLFAKILAWSAVAKAALSNLGARDFKSECAPDDEPCQLAYFVGPQPTDEECAIDWDRRDPPKYPSLAASEGYLGGAIVGYRLSEDLVVHDQRVLAEVPNMLFGDYSLKSMNEWRLAHPPARLPGCKENRITTFIFSIYR